MLRDLSSAQSIGVACRRWLMAEPQCGPFGHLTVAKQLYCDEKSEFLAFVSTTLFEPRVDVVVGQVFLVGNV